MSAAALALVFGLVAAVAYLPWAAAVSTPLRSAAKTLPLAAFALSAWLAGASPYLVMALALSALGDFALSHVGRAAFLYGLASFALAHLLYVLVFTAASGAPLWEAFAITPAAAAALVLMALSTEIWLVPYVGRLTWPVRIYVGLIAAMGLAALTLPAGLALAKGGAALFIASDLILAIRRFRMRPGHAVAVPAAWATWGLYISGQSLILMAFAAP